MKINLNKANSFLLLIIYINDKIKKYLFSLFNKEMIMIMKQLNKNNTKIK